MPPSRGYRTYRGRTSKGKIALAVLLVLVILAALSVLAMQRYIVYDEDGRPFLRLPEREPAEAPEEPPPPEEDGIDIDVIIQEPEEPPVKAFSLPAGPLTGESWQSARAAAGGAYNAVAVTLKDVEGNVYFASETAVRGAAHVEEDTMETLSAVTGEEGLYAIARISCLLDPRASRSDLNAMGLKNTGGYIFYDGNYTTWLNPGKEAAREYLCGLVREIAELGFDEILLTDTGYPTQGKIDKIDYESEGSPLAGNLCLLWEALCKTLEPYEVKLSMELPETVITEGEEAVSALVLARAVSYADRIYAAAEPERVEALSDLTLQAAAVAENRVQDFVPELAEPPAVWEGSFLVPVPVELEE